MLNENETYFSFGNKENDLFKWFVMASIGQYDEYTLSKRRISSMSHTICEESLVGGNGKRCTTSTPLMCKNGDDFTKMNGTMLTSMFVNGSINMGFSDCEILWHSNCSYIAFASLQMIK